MCVCGEVGAVGGAQSKNVKYTEPYKELRTLGTKGTGGLRNLTLFQVKM